MSTKQDIDEDNGGYAKSDEVPEPTNTKSLTVDEVSRLVGSNLRQNEPDYGRRNFIMGYNQAKNEIRERILTGHWR